MKSKKTMFFFEKQYGIMSNKYCRVKKFAGRRKFFIGGE